MDLTRALSLKHIPFRRLYGKNAIQLNCRFCVGRGFSADTRFRLGINLDTDEGRCFNCEWRSRHASRSFAKLLALEVDSGVEDAAPPTPEVKLTLPEGFTHLGYHLGTEDEVIRQALQYIARRGITEKQILRHRIGVSLSGRYAYRVIFPVRVEDKLVGYITRDFTETAKARYLNSTGHEKTLYNCPTVPTSRLVLSEGIFKCLRVAQVLGPGAVSCALLGRTMTDSQMDLLSKADPKEVYVWSDPDAPGLSGTRGVASMLLERGFSVKVLDPRPSFPADEMDLPDLASHYKNRFVSYNESHHHLLALHGKLRSCGPS
jgi:hypothetical protein